MEKNQLTRKLAVILHADVVGSTSLVQQNETIAHKRIQNAFHRFSDTIEAYGGITLELRGDALVAKFDRASDCLVASLAFQVANSELNATLGDNIQPQLRIGISLSEVVIADNTVTGAGVVLAQRLEQLAESGGVCIQGVAYETVPQRLPFEFESLGEQQVKGFKEPVRAYTATLKPGETIPQPESVARPEESTLQLPDKPSIAVLPFANMSGDPEQQYFADGITENIITGLTRFRGLLVIGLSSSFSARDRKLEVQQIGRQLGVGHVVEGSVRKADNRVRVTAQLIDTASEQRIWAEQYDRDLDDIFAVQDEITNIIVATLAGRIEDTGRVRTEDKAAKDMAAHDYLLRGRQCLNRGTKEAILEARRHFESALELDPEFAAAWADLAISYHYEYYSNWIEAPEDVLNHCFQYSQKAVELDDADSKCRYALAWSYGFKNQYDMALIHIDKAIALNPNDYHSLCAKGYYLALSGEFTEGVVCSNVAMRLNPFSPEGCRFSNGIAEFGAKHYEGAIREFGEVASLLPLWRTAYLAACFAHLGRDEQARAKAREVIELSKTEMAVPLGPDPTRWHGASFSLCQNPEVIEDFREGLRKAGLQELLVQ